jgi:hypothetical protein
MPNSHQIAVLAPEAEPTGAIADKIASGQLNARIMVLICTTVMHSC